MISVTVFVLWLVFLTVDGYGESYQELLVCLFSAYELSCTDWMLGEPLFETFFLFVWSSIVTIIDDFVCSSSSSSSRSSSSRTDRWVNLQQNAGLCLFVHTWIVQSMIVTMQLTRTFVDFLPSVCPSCSWRSSLFCYIQLHLVGHSRLCLF